MKRQSFSAATSALTILVSGLLVAQSASAQVTYDPGSAAGKQYEIPVDRVRNDAAGSTDTNSKQSTASPGGATSGGGGGGGGSSASSTGSQLFGAGVAPVKRPGKVNKSVSTRTPTPSSPTTAATSVVRAGLDAADIARARSAERAATVTTGDGRPWLPIVAALLVGVAAAVLVLRRGGPRSPLSGS